MPSCLNSVQLYSLSTVTVQSDPIWQFPSLLSFPDSFIMLQVKVYYHHNATFTSFSPQYFTAHLFQARNVEICLFLFLWNIHMQLDSIRFPSFTLTFFIIFFKHKIFFFPASGECCSHVILANKQCTDGVLKQRAFSLATRLYSSIANIWNHWNKDMFRPNFSRLYLKRKPAVS